MFLCLVALLSLSQNTFCSAFGTPKSQGLTQLSPSISYPSRSGNNNVVDDEDYDPDSVTWNPSQAAEFVMWHKGSPEYAGMQLSPMVANWGGLELGEFLTRLYLGVPKEDDFSVHYDPRKVQDPQWKGLDDDGATALLQLLDLAMSSDNLEPSEMGRAAFLFLLEKHEWQSEKKAIELPSSTFARQGHSVTLAKVFGELRKQRIGEFTVDDVVKMLTIPECRDKSKILQMVDFYTHLGIELGAAELAEAVEGLALAGWDPTGIALFAGAVEEKLGIKIQTPGLALTGSAVDVNVEEEKRKISSSQPFPNLASLDENVSTIHASSEATQARAKKDK